MVNDCAAAVLGKYSVIVVYSIGLLSTALGLLSFSLFDKLIHNIRVRNVAFSLIGVMVIATSFAFAFATNGVLFEVGAVLTLYLLGVIGGSAYRNCAIAFNNKYMGRIIGIGMALAVLLQYVVQCLPLSNLVYLICMTVCVAAVVISYIYPTKNRDVVNSSVLPDKTLSKRSVFVTIAAVTLISVICALLDGIVVPVQAVGQNVLSNFTRLFYAASLVIAGFTADYKKGKYLTLATVCSVFLSVLSSAIFAETSFYWLGVGFIYLFSGFYVMYLTINFFLIASESKKPTLWASMGRIVRSFTVAFATIPTMLLYERFGNVILLISSCILSVAVMLILLRDISSVFVQSKDFIRQIDNQVISKQTSYENGIDDFSASRGLTDRENEVLKNLLLTEDDLQTIADRLFISRRVLQRYITSIYDKTSAKSRIGLIQRYNEYINR
ncbi:MAG: hypothetical protein PHX51_01565 [Clostridia bacterium]|nr:hypothetical protein [Clostridia bacterium]